MIGALRTCTTLPWNVRVGNASTVNSTFCPASTAADVRFGDVGVDLHFRQVIGDREDDRRLKLAATVCPTSTLREMTIPSIGDLIVQ